jgi:hypothetical protein
VGKTITTIFAHYMFAARCKAQGIPPFSQLLHLIATTDWLQCDVLHFSASATSCSCRCSHPTSGSLPSGTHAQQFSATASFPLHHTTSCSPHGNKAVVDDCSGSSHLGAMML